MSKYEQKFLAALVVFIVFSYFFLGEPPDTFAPASVKNTSVMITNLAGNSGGSGVILSSGTEESRILTNGHVCALLQNGGFVVHGNKQFMVSSYTESALHDLCRVSVKENLGVKTPIASSSPRLYDDATISGHPALLPNVITRGHFSEKIAVRIMTGFRECTDEDYKDPVTGFICALLGGMPVVKTFQSVVVTATIMPGSSGSAVFNRSGEIAGLVFAGSGQLGYALAVPFEYVAAFQHEATEELIPDFTLTFDKSSLRNRVIKNLRRVCQNPPKLDTKKELALKEVCQTFSRSSLWDR